MFTVAVILYLIIAVLVSTSVHVASNLMGGHDDPWWGIIVTGLIWPFFVLFLLWEWAMDTWRRS